MNLWLLQRKAAILFAIFVTSELLILRDLFQPYVDDFLCVSVHDIGVLFCLGCEVMV